MKNPMIEMILTRNDEPITDCKRFLDSIAMQRFADFKSISVLIMQEGDDDAADMIADNYPFPVYVHKLHEHVGVSEARNRGIQASTGTFLMFCTCNDMLSSVYSLHLIQNVLPYDEADCLYMDVWREEIRRGPFINVIGRDITIVAGKLYRRKMLVEKNVTFHPDMRYCQDPLFNMMMFLEVPTYRAKKIDTTYALYAVAMRKGQQEHTVMMDELLRTNMIMTETAIQRGYTAEANKYAVQTMFDAYFILGTREVPVSDEARKDAYAFIRKNVSRLDNMRRTGVELEMNSASSKKEYIVQYMYNYFGIELMPPVEAIRDAREWIHRIAGTSGQEQTARKETAQASERVVVYCGTENVYPSMILSAKTLLAHTRVDKIYFLTEHDEFPEKLPGIIQNINVSNQKFFPKNGPNYESAWTYMCLMRAAFTKLFPQHDKVLSLDIDVAVNEDISALWDYDMTDYYIAGVHENKRPADDYINFGVVMMNLAKIRADRLDDRMIDSLNASHWDCPEQSVFSEFCKGHILLIPSDYNYIPNSGLTDEPEIERITHYAGIKYWKHYGPFRKYLNMSFEQVLSANPHVAVYGGTRNTYEMMLVSVKSLLQHTPMDKVYLLIEDDTFPYELPDCVECINVSNQHYFSKDNPNYNSGFTYIPLLRAVYDDMFPQYDRILSLDNDTLIKRDISGLFDLAMGANHIAAVRETRNQPIEKPSVYYSTGVMLMNLKQIRIDHVSDKVVDLLAKQKFDNDTQDAYNYVCDGTILPLPSDYNACTFTAPPDTVYIQHYAGNKKKQFWRDAEPYKNMTWKQVLDHE